MHDLSDGGLIVAAAEMALASDVGITLDATSRAHAHIFLFGEDQGRYLIATREPERVIAQALAAHVNVARGRRRRRRRLRLRGAVFASTSPSSAPPTRAGCRRS